MKTTINLSLTKDESNNCSININLGGPFVLSVDDSWAHFHEELAEGTCSVSMEDNASVHSVLRRHNLTQLTRKDNPEIFGVLRRVYLEGNEKGFNDKKLKSRCITTKGDGFICKERDIKITKDKNVSALLRDSEFLRITGKCASL
ncbi:MAG: hypothetical protein LBI81_00035 [Puniceicoccales bacterium]|jgi:hypothetical protein|nr:hypothetical protein [Puniceicoccales bacterium]